MAEELSETKRIAKKQVKSAKKEAAYNVRLAQRRFEMLKDLKVRVGEFVR